ncbi:DNA internalization-related competence protein ComEC/Rec2 [Pseudodesulfovibrio sp. S3]|nr:DNA internalization-related competence protein ComEC/Rec2 [Pseudodesulfovibrio sp. S3]
MPGLMPWQTYMLAFVVGVSAVQFPVPAIAALALLYAADCSFRERGCRLSVFAVVCCAVFGFGYASQRTPDLPESVPHWMEARQPVTVDGVVDRVEPLAGGRLRVVLREVQCDQDGVDKALPGKVAWSLRHPDYIPAPGQSVRALVRVVPVHNFGNPGTWDYVRYWQRQGVFWRAWPQGKEKPEWGDLPHDFLWGIKSGLRRAVASSLPETQGGAMVLALTTGDRSRLTPETMEATRSSGLAHTLALSGLHVGFVAAMGVGLALLAGLLYPPILLFVPRPKLAVLLAAPLVLGYAWLGQPSASLIRAAVMFGFWGLLLLQGRGRVLLDGLFFALAAIVFVSPLSVFDLSLQMSVTAVAGIGLMYPCFRCLFVFKRSRFAVILGWAGALLAISVCANIALMPLVSWYFGTFSPNILLNFIWLPVLGFAVMPLGLVGMFLSASAWTAPVGGVLLGLAAGVADWLLVLLYAERDAGLTPILAVLRPLWPETLGFVILLITAAAVLRSDRRVPKALAGLGFVLLVLPHVWIMVEDSRNQTRLTMLDVGLGQSLVISLPGGHRWLVDAGGGSKTFDFGEAVVAPSLTLGRPPRLDAAFMSHPDVDHSHGLPFILDRFAVKSFYTNGMLPRGQTGRRLRAVLDANGLVPVALQAGDTVPLSEDTKLCVLHPSEGFVDAKANELSLVLRLEKEGRSLALLPGDIEKRGIRSLMESRADPVAEVLVLPHHGSRSSFDASFYQAVSARAILCSNGYLNQYGFPASTVVEAVGGTVFTTARHGQVVCLWRGQQELSIQSSVSDLTLATGLLLR